MGAAAAIAAFKKFRKFRQARKAGDPSGGLLDDGADKKAKEGASTSPDEVKKRQESTGYNSTTY